MEHKDERERALHAEQAADWYVGNRSNTTQAEREAFIRWLKRSPQHVEEYLGVASVARDLRKTRSAADDFPLDELIARAKADKLETLPLPRPPRAAKFQPPPVVRWVALAASIAAVGVLGFLASSAWNARHQLLTRDTHATGVSAIPPILYATGRGQQRTVQLPDGSVLHLNTDTAVAVNYSAARREALLMRGQADFEVRHDAQRAFVVIAHSAQITDVGTKFDVNLENDTTVITVVEGLVEVAPAPTPATRAAAGGSAPAPRKATPQQPIQLSANQQLSVSAEEWPSAPKSVDAQRATAWLRRQIVFEHQPLERVAAEFNRYTATPIEIVTPALRELQISGVFSTDDPDAFIAFLRSLDGVDVKVTPTRVVVAGKAAAQRGH